MAEQPGQIQESITQRISTNKPIRNELCQKIFNVIFYIVYYHNAGQAFEDCEKNNMIESHNEPDYVLYSHKPNKANYSNLENEDSSEEDAWDLMHDALDFVESCNTDLMEDGDFTDFVKIEPSSIYLLDGIYQYVENKQVECNITQYQVTNASIRNKVTSVVKYFKTCLNKTVEVGNLVYRQLNYEIFNYILTHPQYRDYAYGLKGITVPAKERKTDITLNSRDAERKHDRPLQNLKQQNADSLHGKVAILSQTMSHVIQTATNNLETIDYHANKQLPSKLTAGDSKLTLQLTVDNSKLTLQLTADDSNLTSQLTADDISLTHNNEVSSSISNAVNDNSKNPQLDEIPLVPMLEQPSQGTKPTEQQGSFQLFETDKHSNLSSRTVSKTSLPNNSSKCTENVKPKFIDLVCDVVSSIITTIPLKKDDKVYEEVKSAFFASMCVSYEIVQIDCIQNQMLSESYSIAKELMDAGKHESTNDKVNERRLWHGTTVRHTNVGLMPITRINLRGFNRSYCSTSNGAVYGNGVYFAPDANTSAKYSTPDENGYRYMYYCKVLTGEYTVGVNGINDAPVKDPSQGTWYDSVVDRVASPTMFVIFNDMHAYPEYLITFK